MNDRHGCRGERRLRRAGLAGRREFLRVGALGLGGLTLGDWLQRRAEAAPKHYDSVEGPAKSVVQIFLPGGCAHQESWDPKPESPLEYRGPFGTAKTVLPGVVFSEHLKRCAEIADKLCKADDQQLHSLEVLLRRAKSGNALGMTLIAIMQEMELADAKAKKRADLTEEQKRIEKRLSDYLRKLSRPTKHSPEPVVVSFTNKQTAGKGASQKIYSLSGSGMKIVEEALG